jgi:hypothetical protein
MPGPLGSLVEFMLRDMSMANETSIFITDAQREARVMRLRVLSPNWKSRSKDCKRR